MLKPEQLRVRNVLLDTITLLCKNSLRFSQTLSIEGVIGITIDGTDLFLVHANETIRADGSSTASGVEQHDVKCEEPTAHQSLLPASMNQTTPTVLCTKSPAKRSPMKVKVERDICTTAGDHADDLDIQHNRKFGNSGSKSCRSSMSMVLTPAAAKRNAGKSGKSFAASSTVMHESFTKDEGIGFVGDMFVDMYAKDTTAYEQDAYDETYVDMDESAWINEATGLPTASNQQEMLYRRMQKNSAGQARPKQVRSTRGLHTGRTRGGRRGVMVGCEAQLTAMNVAHVPRHGQSKLLHKAPRSCPQGSEFVITESTHICGYPGCSKRFRFKHDLLRHQTKMHGREPVRRVAPESALPESVSMSGSDEYGENLDYYADYHN